MGEKAWESLLKTAEVLHWLGKHTEANYLTLLARLLKRKGIDDLAALETLIGIEGA